MSRGALAIVAAACIGGCGGSAEEQTFTPADATRIANVRPEIRGWTWPKNPKMHVSSDSRTEAQATDPLDVKLKRQTADIVPSGDAGSKWQDADKLAHLSAQVFASPAKTHELMAPFNAYSRGWAKRSDALPRTRRSQGSATRPGSSGPKATAQR
jgi:hypothetical protein